MSKSYRPKYHASVPSGWANDPNGTIFYNGKAHLFFQHYPHKPEWGTMHWGHFTTTDFVHWTTLPVALVPDQDYEVLCGCCSGSAIEKDGKLYLIYTAALSKDRTTPFSLPACSAKRCPNLISGIRTCS